MKFLVFSDTHGDIKKAVEICRQREKDGFDAVIPLGDYIRDAEALAEEIDICLYSVRGNCDGDYGSGDFKVIETEAGDILLTHGHGQKVKRNLMNLIYRAQELDCVAALFGHTHMPLVEEEEGILLINPGSLTHSAEGSVGSYAIVETDNEGVRGSICYYQKSEAEPKAKPTAKRVIGGHLRNILNNCDRL